MKSKMSLFVLIISIFATFIPVAAQTNDDIWVRVVRQYERTNANTGEVVSFDIRFYIQFEELPFIQDGQVFIPIREVAESIGLGVNLDREAQSITVLGVANEVLRTVSLDVQPLIANGRLFVTLPFIGESLGLYTHWDGGTRIAALTTPVTQFTYIPSRIVWIARGGGDIYHSHVGCGNINPEWATRTTRRAARAAGNRACRNCW